MSSEKKLKHLEFIQGAIDRMAGNSFLLKGWSVTLVAALFALAASNTDKQYVIIAFLPVVVFWIIDGYFLSRERGFRKLYDKVREETEEQIDFSMHPKDFLGGGNSWPCSIFRPTLLIFYSALIIIMVAVQYFIK